MSSIKNPEIAVRMRQKTNRNVFGYLFVIVYLVLILLALINKAIIVIYYPQLAYAIGIFLLISFILMTRFLFNKKSKKKED